MGLGHIIIQADKDTHKSTTSDFALESVSVQWQFSQNVIAHTLEYPSIICVETVVPTGIMY